MESKNVKTILATVCVFACVVCCIIVGFKFMKPKPVETQPVSDLEVPNFIGMMWSDVANDRELREHYLFTILDGNDSDKATGEILSQKPDAGTEAIKGQRIELTVNGGAEIPDMLDYDKEEAEKLLDVLGLMHSTIEEYSDEVEAGCVVSTEPEAGSVIDFGSEVTIHVSKGKRKVRVPRVVGLEEREAIKLMTEEGFTCRIESVADGTVQPGQVSDTEPKGSTMAPFGSEVVIKVNNGSADRMVKVPVNLTGQSLNNVTRELNNIGLLVGTIKLDDESEKEKDTVIGLSVRGGTEVKEGTSIDLTVSSGKGAPKTLSHELELPYIEDSVELKVYVNGSLTENIIVLDTDKTYSLSLTGVHGADIVMVTLDDSVYAQLTFDYDIQRVSEEILFTPTPSPSPDVDTTLDVTPGFSPFF